MEKLKSNKICLSIVSIIIFAIVLFGCGPSKISTNINTMERVDSPLVGDIFTLYDANQVSYSDTTTGMKSKDLQKALDESNEKITALEDELKSSKASVQALTKAVEDAKSECDTFKQRCVTLATANKESIVDNIISKETFETDDAKEERKKELMMKSMKDLKAMEPVQRTIASVTSPCLATEDHENQKESNGKTTDTNKQENNQKIVTVNDAAQEVIVTEDDCGTTKGVEVSAIVDTFENVVIEPLYDRIVNRYSLDAVFDPKTNKQLVGPNEIISPEIAKAIEAAGVETVTVRSAIHCKAKNGICRHCFGNDLTTNKPVEIGTAIGVVAAQSIGEPGTQLNLRTFHTGGASGSAGGNIAQGFERLKQLFDMIPPKDYELAL